MSDKGESKCNEAALARGQHQGFSFVRPASAGGLGLRGTPRHGAAACWVSSADALPPILNKRLQSTRAADTGAGEATRAG